MEGNAKIQKVISKTTIVPSKKKIVKYRIALIQNDLNVFTQDGFSFIFKKATPINDKGKSFVTYIVDVDPAIVGTTTKDIIFVVGGFGIKVKTNNQKIILATSIPIGLISLAGTIWLTKHFFKSNKKVKKSIKK